MERTRLQDMNCGIARALDVFGDRWSLLVLREIFFGARRFSQIQRSLGIARNILSQRLDHLVEREILERVDVGEHGSRYEYELTPRGEALLPVLTAMREWSDSWVFGRGNEPVVVKERSTGRRVAPLALRGSDGRRLARRDLRMQPGPGADEGTRARFETTRRSPRGTERS